MISPLAINDWFGLLSASNIIDTKDIISVTLIIKSLFKSPRGNSGLHVKSQDS